MTRLTKLTAGLMGAAALTALSAPAYAVGTEAGTSVANEFTLTYDTGTDTRTITNDCGTPGATTTGTCTPSNSPTTFVVDRVVNLTVTGQDSDDNSPGDTDVPVVYTVTNLGNDEQSYLLDTEFGTNTDFALDAAPTIEYVVVASGATCAATVPGTATTYAGTAATAPVVPADSVLCVYVSSDIPATASDGENANYDLLVTTTDTGTITPLTYGGTNDPNDVENVAIETGAGPHSGDDGTPNGVLSAVANYSVGAATVTALKAVELVNQSGGCPTFAALPAPSAAATVLHVPGACVEYTITVTNSGTGDATDVDLTDALPIDIVFAEALTEGEWSAPAPTPSTATGACSDGGTGCTVVSALNGTLPGAVSPDTTVATLRIRGTIRSTGPT